nr:immunoglobulin light chain junction region [Macaca mulatta]MPO09822.1 immunoglobulin light chain junction region [Macaca mulatta]MPO14149.1 immunoglobulin light chain junction region [Macaca mulatta]
CSSYTDSNVFF